MTKPISDAASRGRIGAYRRWSRTADRTAALAPARSAFLARFEREVDPDGTLPGEERSRRAEFALKAHMTELARKRRQRRAA